MRRRSSALSPGYFVLSRYFALLNRPMNAANTLPSRYVAFTSLMMTPHVFVPAEKVRASRGVTHHVDIMTHGWHHPTATDRGIDRICFVGSSCSFSRMQGKDFLAPLLLSSTVLLQAPPPALLRRSLIGSRNYSTKKYQVAQARCAIDTWLIGRFSTHALHTVCQTIYCA